VQAAVQTAARLGAAAAPLKPELERIATGQRGAALAAAALDTLERLQR